VTDASRYRVPRGAHRVETTVKRSRFIATAARAPTPDAAHALVERVREEMRDATHHCWAFVAGPPGSTAQIGMSDDGEPHGTAGRPMLHALLHSGIGEIAVVCTRYFGGTKLGTGGLSRAYAEAVKSVLATLPTAERVERERITVTIGYGEVDAVQRLFAAHDVVIEGEEYAADVRYRLAVPTSDRHAFESALAEASQGRAIVEGRPAGDEA
jgi:uncharacterized YigZ family protein